MLDDNIIKLWNGGMYSLGFIGDFYGVTRQAVKKYLNRRGIDTVKGSRKIKVICGICNKVEYRLRCRVRDHIKHYCSQGCYIESMKNSDYQANRHGQRIARRKVGEIFPLQDGYVVHHKDGNCKNNELSNLAVFRKQADHTSYHRGGEGRWIWEFDKSK